MNAYHLFQLGEIVERVQDKVTNRNDWNFNKYVAGEHIDSGQIRIKKYGVITGNEQVIGPAFHMKFKPGHVLYSTRRAYLRKAGMVDFEGVCSNVTLVLLSDEKKLIQSLLPFILQSENFVQFAISHSIGSTNPFVKWSDLKKFKINLPSINIQKQISKILWAIENTIERIEILIKIAEKLMQSLLSELLTKGIGHKKFKVTELGKIPEDWETGRITDFFMTRSGSTPRRKNKEYFNGKIPWVKTLDLNNDAINSTQEKITTKAIAETSCKIVPANSVLIAMYGGFLQIGRTGILQMDAATNQAITALFPNQDEFNPRFVNYFLIKQRFKWKEIAASSRRDPNITKRDVDNFLICKPCLQEQDKIVNTIDKCNNYILNLNTTAKKMFRLRKKLTDDMLSGNIFVQKEANN